MLLKTIFVYPIKNFPLDLFLEDQKTQKLKAETRQIESKEKIMTAPTKGIKNIGSLIFGAILLLIGLIASFYEASLYYSDGTYRSSGGYPYQTVGIVLILVGIVFVGLGLFYSPRKTES